MVLKALFRFSSTSSTTLPAKTDAALTQPSLNSNVVSKPDNGTDEEYLTAATSTSMSDVNDNLKDAHTPRDSHQSLYTTEPSVQVPYDADSALTDIPGIAFALDLFLQSKMIESEDFCVRSDGKMERLYFATGYGLIQCVKGLMSYEDEDLLAGIAHTKQGNHVASLHRKKNAFLGSQIAGYVVSSVIPTDNLAWIKNMTDVERHAELIYAESLFEKALLGIVFSGDWLAFIKEALNMRVTISIYRQLGTYVSHMDEKAAAANPNTPIDVSIDEHFRSGVYLGVGICNLILSLMPGKLMTLVELFGYKGDRELGLEMLMKAGGWAGNDDEPGVTASEEGVRRPICDMALLIFHLVLSSFTFEGVDVSVATRVLKWNLKRYPDGVFFLFGAGRLSLVRSQPSQAIQYYTRAMQVQSQYRNLHHVSFWEIAIANFALWDLEASLACWRELEKEATWSKAIYSYGLAVCLLESAGPAEIEEGEREKERAKRKEEAARLMLKVPTLRQKIAGKSIPFEKFVARKARKFHLQHQHLALPALEMAYLFQGVAHTTPLILVERMLPEVACVLQSLGVDTENVTTSPTTPSDSKGKEKEKGNQRYKKVKEKDYDGYWDDYCLAMFLRGVCMRYIAYPDPDAILDDDEISAATLIVPKDQAEKHAEAAFKAVFQHGPKIQLDHHLVYHAHYELGRLYACQSQPGLARSEFDLLLSGKTLEVGPSGKKGKYSMENALMMRTHAAVDALSKGGKRRL